MRLAVLSLLAGCAAPGYREAARETPDPFLALEYVGLALRADRDDEPSIDLLTDLAKRIATEHSVSVARLEASGAFEEAVAQCDRVAAARALVAALPRTIEIAHDPGERARFAGEAARRQDARGLVLLEEGRAGEAKLAFERALTLRPGLEAARAHLRQAKQVAPLRLEVYPFEALATEASGLAASLTRETIEAVTRKIPEGLVVFPAGQSGASASCRGAIQSFAFREIPSVPHPGKNEHASWIVFESRSEVTLTVSLHAERVATGAPVAALVVTRTASDVRRHATVQGEVSALPAEIARLPRAPAAAKREAELTPLAVSLVAEALARGLIEATE